MTAEKEAPSKTSTFDEEESSSGEEEEESEKQPVVGKAIVSADPDVFRRIIVLRHAERLDRVFPDWQKQACINGSYRPYNVNHPTKLPMRRGGLAAFSHDPPITELGRMVARLVAQSVAIAGHKLEAIYVSPALRCLQTAEVLVRILGPVITRIEPGLFDFAGFYESLPSFLTETELQKAGISVDKEYKPFLTRFELGHLIGRETKQDYYHRAKSVVQNLLMNTVGTVLIVAHAPTVDACCRALLDLPRSVPAERYFDHLSDQYPYCTSVLLDQLKTSGAWKLGKPLLPVHFLNQSTVFDRNCLTRR